MGNDLNIHSKLMEDGFVELAASKIYTKLSELRESDNERISRRWIWELIQNANDCANPQVTIDIKNSNDFLRFSHNGKPFDYQSLISISTQRSKKGSNKEGDLTGKFGTGFITTHLLSEKVQIKGIFINTKLKRSKLDFCLNRSGQDELSIQNEVRETLKALQEIDSNFVEPSNMGTNFETNFIYDLKSADKKAVEDGRKDFEKSIFFVLAFAKKIEKISYNGVIYKKGKVENIILDKDIDYKLNIVNIIMEKENIKKNKKILICSDDVVEVAASLKIENNIKYIEKFNPLIPKIFCGFPLVGTEKFFFPVIVNSSKFGVEEPRDGIREKSKVNKELLFNAVNLYEKMLIYVRENSFKNIYNLCFLRNSSHSSLQKELEEKVKNICENIAIIDTKNNNLISLKNSRGEKNILLFEDVDEENYSFWELMDLIRLKLEIPKKESYKFWTKALGENFKFKKLVSFIEKKERLDILESRFESKEDAYNWLNKFYEIAFDIENGKYVKQNRIILNEAGEFVGNINELAINIDINEELLLILLELEKNSIIVKNENTKSIQKRLVSKQIKLPNSSKNIISKEFGNKEIADEICYKIRVILGVESKNKFTRTKETQKIFTKIMMWFFEFPKIASELFGDIYENKTKLCSNEEISKKVQLAEEAEETLKKFNIESMDELNEKLNNLSNLTEQNTEENQVDLLMGLELYGLEENSLEEVKVSLKYESTKSYEALVKVKSLINRSKKNVINHLNNIECYNINELQELSNTVYGNVLKNGEDIKIVVRPCDNDKVIFFYESELETLEEDKYELWIDNGIDIPKQLTLGDILNTTGVRVIPLKYLFENE